MPRTTISAKPKKRSRKLKTESAEQALPVIVHSPYRMQLVFSSLIGLCLIGIAILLGFFLRHPVVVLFDEVAHLFMTSIVSDSLSEIMKHASWFGLYGTLLLTLLMSVFLGLTRRWYAFGLLVTVMIMPYLFGFGLKFYYQRPRPVSAYGFVESSFSYPSHHALTSVILWMLLPYLYVYFTGNLKRGVAFLLVGYGLSQLIGFSRVYLQVHYFSDIIGGICFGLGSLLMFSAFVKALCLKQIKNP